MAVTIQTLMAALDGLLTPQAFQDYCPNGLQVEGKPQIEKLVCGVTASQAFIDQAIAEKADAVFVHHGFFWKGEDPRVVGMKRKRLQALINNNINLIAYHLPLDAHPQLGNNAQLATLLDIEITGGLEAGNELSVGNVGRLSQPVSASAFAEKVAQVLNRQPQVIEGGDHTITTIAWCTGAAQNYIEKAINCKVDAYLSGEISESTVHTAREMGIHYFAAGHHATERYGVQAVGKFLAEKFEIECQFIDSDSPV